MFSVIFIICPDRTSLILFGTIYSHWLLYIHSERINITQPQIMNSWAANWDKVCDTIGLVTPMYHALHHRRPDLNFSHFVQWDKLLFPYHKHENNKTKDALKITTSVRKSTSEVPCSMDGEK